MSDAELEVHRARAGGRVIIGFKDSSAAAGVDERGRSMTSELNIIAAKSHLRAQGIPIEQEFRRLPIVVARLTASQFVELRTHPMVEYVEPDGNGGLSADVIGWNISRVKAPETWDSTTGTGAKLLILDTGISLNHPELSPTVAASCDPEYPSGGDGSGHGTSVAGIAAALANGGLIVGAAPDVELWSVKVGPDSANITISKVMCGVEYARTHGADVINMSLWQPACTGLADVINAAYYEDDIVVVVATGNESGAVRFPATLPSTIAVSATTMADTLATLSNIGPQVELAAPGFNVTSTTIGSSVIQVGYAGTSYAAPHVSAAAAMLKSYNSSWDAWEIRRRLLVGASDLGATGWDIKYGHGLLNIEAALNAAAPNAPSIEILGPASVRPGAACTWEASTSGGVSPFAYSWYAGHTALIDDGFVEYEVVGYTHGQSFKLSVTATGADLAFASTERWISVADNAPLCAQ